jgi:hypothetical protein
MRAEMIGRYRNPCDESNVVEHRGRMSVSLYRDPMYVICIVVAQVNVFLDFSVSVVVPRLSSGALAIGE